MAPVLVLGTRNRKKCQEIAEILGGLGLDLRDIGAFPGAPEVVEDGATFEANARKKASVLARALGHWVLGEDSGLVVPALGGQPGVYSARYAGKQGDDEANNERLLAELTSMAEDKRAAYYVCTAALADPKGEVRAVVEGRCHGVILRERRGTGGFGFRRG
jgi:XTP/dITP diphosphohydrolase